jgi:tRNA-intron endonuclease
MATGKLTESRVTVKGEAAEDIHTDKYYGKMQEEGHLELSLEEAYHLIQRDMLEVVRDGEKLEEEDLFEVFSEKDDEFDFKYRVYSDLRERGLIVKSGFKFGAHFRVYERGVNPYVSGSKKQRQHTKWIVHAVPEHETLSFQEMSRAVRLAQNIRATMLWAVVDSEAQVTYYEVEHTNP